MEAGDFSVIFTSPEILLQYASVFLFRPVCNMSSLFTKRLACIAIDKAHLVWGWRTFRKEYAALGTLRHCFPKVPIMALSATITPNVLGYIRESLHLHAPTPLYKQPLDRPNITQMVTHISKQGFGDLDYLVPKVGIIPKTMVFMEKIEDVMALAAHLRRLLPPEDRDRGDDLIMTFHSNMKATTRVDIMENFRNGEIRILIYTDAARMGVNIPNITRVIQWKMSENLTFASRMQHFGRAERNPRIAAVSLLFIEDCYLLPDNVNSLTERTVTNKNLEIVKISPFRDKTMPVSRKNRKEISTVISSLYAGNMQIRKDKGLNVYHQVDPALLWYINTTGCRKRLALACFMCKTAFERHLDDNNFCYDICFYKANAENLDNAGDKIPSFKLHGVTGSLSLCYRLTEEFKREQVRLEQERLRKKVLLDKAASTITHDQQESCYKALENFAHRK